MCYHYNYYFVVIIVVVILLYFCFLFVFNFALLLTHSLLLSLIIHLFYSLHSSPDPSPTLLTSPFLFLSSFALLPSPSFLHIYMCVYIYPSLTPSCLPSFLPFRFYSSFPLFLSSPPLCPPKVVAQPKVDIEMRRAMCVEFSRLGSRPPAYF